MMLIDEREPIEEMQILLRPHGKDVYSQHLDFGDYAFDGYGPRGVVLVGVERKRIDDIVNSIHSGRFAGHQLPGLIETFDYSYLVIEGMFRRGDDGELTTPRG